MRLTIPAELEGHSVVISPDDGGPGVYGLRVKYATYDTINKTTMIMVEDFDVNKALRSMDWERREETKPAAPAQDDLTKVADWLSRPEHVAMLSRVLLGEDQQDPKPLAALACFTSWMGGAQGWYDGNLDRSPKPAGHEDVVPLDFEPRRGTCR